MPTYLHKPITSLDEIEALFPDESTNRPGTPEQADLEFKAKLWEDAPKGGAGKFEFWEFCKDVAAMLNSVGGDIVIGVEEEHSRAKRWFRTGDNKFPLGTAYDTNTLRSLRQRLANAIEPREALSYIHYRGLEDPDSSTERRRALVVSLAPFPHGPVSIRCMQRLPSTNRDNDRILIAQMYPRREGDEVKFMEQGEIARMMAPKSRAIELTIRRYLDRHPPPAPVRFSSQTCIDYLGVSVPIPGRSLLKFDGHIMSMDNGILNLELTDLTRLAGVATASAATCAQIMYHDKSTIKTVATASTDLRDFVLHTSFFGFTERKKSRYEHAGVAEIFEQEKSRVHVSATMLIPLSRLNDCWEDQLLNTPNGMDSAPPIDHETTPSYTQVLRLDVAGKVVHSQFGWHIET